MKTLKPLLALVVIAFVLAACSGPGIEVGTVYMKGILEKEVPVTTSGYWRVRTSDSWLKAIPSSDFGSGTVRLKVDPSTLPPGEYTSSIALEMPGQPPQVITVVFAFPRLRGSVVIGPKPGPVLFAQQGLQSGPGRLLVGLRDAGTADLRRLVSDAVGDRPGVRVRRTLERARVAVLEVNDMRAAAAALSRDPNVRYVEQEVPLELLQFSDYSAEQWPHTVMRVKEAWGIGAGMGSSSIKVAVIDAGFDAGHPDLDGNITYTWDFVSNQASLTPRPACGPHGEHVAGIVAAEANGTGVDGVAPAVGIQLLNVGSTEGNTCPINLVDVAAALYWVAGDATGPRADIVNLSLGGPPSTTLQDAVEAAYRAGVTLVAASGNSPAGNVLYPAAYPEVIAVSATGASDELASYTTVGPEVFVSAPGGNDRDFVLSTGYEYNADNTVKYTILGMQGTSMASPAVAAVAALVKSANTALTPVGIAGLLADSSVDLGDPGRDEEFGYGRVDAYDAVAGANNSPPGYVLRVAGSEWAIPVVERFVAGYVGGEPFVEVGTDNDWDGTIGEETGDYYGTWQGPVEFTGEFFDVEVAVTQK